jgi:AcrR family transcriptional regulator
MKLVRRIDDSEFIKEYDIREHKFMTMEEEKRERIIDAALKEFSKGYMEANTDVIVKEAGISKGLIFHYFGSKRGLFLFLIKYALDITVTEYEKVISKSNDFLENMRIASKTKADMSLRYPLLFRFIVKAQSSIKEVFPEGLPGDLLNMTHMGMQQICQRSNNDESLFKEGIDSEKAQNIIIWTMSGFIDSLLRYGDDVDAYKAHYVDFVKEEEEYLQTLRKILYR